MDRDARHLLTRAKVDQREEMLVDRVNTAAPNETDEVNGPAVALRDVAGLDEGGIREERLVPNRFSDAHQVLHHDAAGAEVQMPDLAVSHLTFGEANREARRLEQR